MSRAREALSNDLLAAIFRNVKSLGKQPGYAFQAEIKVDFVNFPEWLFLHSPIRNGVIILLSSVG